MTDWVQKQLERIHSQKGQKGGPGSGHHGHAGRPGKRGGSLPGKAGASSRQVAGGRAPTERHEDMWLSVQKLNHLKDGLDMGKTSVLMASKYQRETAKMQVVADLAKRTGLPAWQVNETIKTWSHSSSDHEMASLQMQKAVADEFGLDFSRLEANYEATKKESEIFQETRSGAWTAYDKRRLEPSPFSEPERRKLVRAMYEATQESLAAAGFEPDDMIRVQRGTRKPHVITKDWQVGGTVRVGTNPMSSWTGDTSTEISHRFAKPNATRERPGFILEMEVPVRSIFSTPRTGFGCLTEAEFVILAAEHQARVVRVYTRG